MAATITLLGATGYTGRLVASALARRSCEFLVAGRDRPALDALAADIDRVSGVRTVDVTDDEALRALAQETDVLLTTVGPFIELGRPVLRAAIRGGAHYVDSTGEQPFIAWAFDEQHEETRAAGVAAVPACGFDYVPGDLLAAVAAEQLATPREIHVSYLAEVGPRSLTRGTRASIAGMLGRDGLAVEGGQRVEERFADVRRLAWFPRPVGPRRAAGLPGGEPITVPRHVEGLRTVRTYLAIPGVLAELVQSLSVTAGWPPARRLLRRVLLAGPEGPTPERRRAVRWACVAEAVGEDGEVAHAWAAGRDIYGFTAEAMAAVAHRLAGGTEVTGVIAPAQVTAPTSLLDDLAVTTGLRWTVRERG